MLARDSLATPPTPRNLSIAPSGTVAYVTGLPGLWRGQSRQLGFEFGDGLGAHDHEEVFASAAARDGPRVLGAADRAGERDSFAGIGLRRSNSGCGNSR